MVIAQIVRAHRREILFLVAGVFAGYIIFHPYAMLANLLLGVYRYGDIHFTRDELLHVLQSGYHPEMLPMSLSFALFGGAIGLLSGILIGKRRKLREAELDNLMKKTAVETLQRIMITLSHYLLNANTVIGGNARRRKKYTAAEDFVVLLDVIDEESRKIEAVVNALRRITDLKTADYTAEGQGLMIDIAKELDELIASGKETQGVAKDSL